MLQELVEIVFVSPIKFKYTYTKMSSSRNFYFPNYEVEKPHLINKENIKVIPYSSGCTILIKKKGKYYWCPHYEKVYKDTITGSARRSLIRNSQLYIYKDGYILKFEHNKQVYRTHEVKLVKLV